MMMKQYGIFWFLIVSFSWCLTGVLCVQAESDRPDALLIINEDNDHYFKLSESLMTRKALEEYIDQFGGTKVTHFFMCPNGQRTSYRSKVHESIWDNIDRYENPVKWSKNAKALFDQGIDPYSVWIERCRKNKISPWITMRMNDVHGVTTPNHFRTTDHWRNHPELWCVPHYKGTYWPRYSYDYTKKEVRDYHLALVQELLDRYDTDGLELDWMRFGFHLTTGKEKENARFLTEFVERTRELVDSAAKKRGHSIQLGVRVPSTPEAAVGLGMDAVQWAQKGLIDFLVVSCFFTTTDYNINVNSWRKVIGQLDRSLVIVPACDDGCSAGPGTGRIYQDPALIRGWAIGVEYLGAKDHYLFNFVYFPIGKPEFREILTGGLATKDILNKARRHPITYVDCTPEGADRQIQLPKVLDKKLELTINTGTKPTEGDLRVILAFEKNNKMDLKVLLNGCESIAQTELKEIKRYSDRDVTVIAWDFALSSLHDGFNKVTIVPSAGETSNGQRILWAEIECGKFQSGKK